MLGFLKKELIIGKEGKVPPSSLYMYVQTYMYTHTYFNTTSGQVQVLPLSCYFLFSKTSERV